MLTINCLGEIVLSKLQLPTQHFRVGCRLLYHLGKPFVWRNYFKQLFSHIPPQFQFNGIFQQSEGVWKYFFSSAINSSLSFINEQIFRLLLKISVYERHQLRIWTIYQASFEEAITSLGHADNSTLGSYEVWVAHKPHQTFPNQFFHQISVIDSSRAQKQKWETLQKNSEANSTQCSQAVTHPSTD